MVRILRFFSVCLICVCLFSLYTSKFKSPIRTMVLQFLTVLLGFALCVLRQWCFDIPGLGARGSSLRTVSFSRMPCPILPSKGHVLPVLFYLLLTLLCCPICVCGCLVHSFCVVLLSCITCKQHIDGLLRLQSDHVYHLTRQVNLLPILSLLR